MMKSLLLLAAVCAVTVYADKVVFKDCGSVSGTIKSVDIQPCPKEPCIFKHNTNVNVSVDFTANVDITKATTKVYGVIMGVKVPFPVPSDACKNMTCPSSKGSEVVYKNAVFVKPVYPKVRVVVQWEIHDQNDKFIACFNVPVQISD